MDIKYPMYEFQIDNIDELYIEVFEKWCKENCSGSRNISGHNHSYNTIGAVTIGVIRIRFSEEKDAVAFKLRWM